MHMSWLACDCAARSVALICLLTIVRVPIEERVFGNNNHYRDIRIALQGELSIGEHRITAVAFCPSGDYLAIGDDSGGLSVWDINESTPVISVESAHVEAILSITFDNDDTVSTFGREGRLLRWNPKTGAPKSERLSLPAARNWSASRHDVVGNAYLLSSTSGLWLLSDTDSVPLQLVESPVINTYTTYANADTQLVAIGEGHDVSVYDLSSRRVISQIRLPVDRNTPRWVSTPVEVWRLSFCATTEPWLAFKCGSKNYDWIGIVDFENGNVVRTLEASRNANIKDIKSLPQRSLLVGTGVDLQFWDIYSGEMIDHVPGPDLGVRPRASHFTSIDFCESDMQTTLVAVGTATGTVSLFRVSEQ